MLAVMPRRAHGMAWVLVAPFLVVALVVELAWRGKKALANGRWRRHLWGELGIHHRNLEAWRMKIYLLVSDETTGPFGLDEISEKLARGEVAETDMWCEEGDAAWRQLTELMPLLAGAGQPSAPVAVPPTLPQVVAAPPAAAQPAAQPAAAAPPRPNIWAGAVYDLDELRRQSAYLALRYAIHIMTALGLIAGGATFVLAAVMLVVTFFTPPPNPDEFMALMVGGGVMIVVAGLTVVATLIVRQVFSLLLDLTDATLLMAGVRPTKESGGFW